MKKTTVVLSAALALGSLALSNASLADTGGMESLRGAKQLESTNKAPDMAKNNDSDVLVERNYIQQPPVIPHEIRNYRVDLRSNKCLSCHSWERYKESGATKVSLTHFETRGGHALADISPRRYFCMQCHVPQATAEPLIDNTYQSTSDLAK
ncbi:nitrate reductase cytochrome c-type subunit [Motiliproteus coralliicola]|uniref:Periplasmic nitrate reductase, electron transfer subunit n=1 Tax=Motiliproteus coralliicola TaxID=2283196 RepID=A0A369WPR6_9GAMM|nr:nitrate reductase cytochrome c-type subunit [Motiliproteus coralliicola]RDE24070.1 nitrate reductase cytochrome c-type subunit [Motiliproteus coralliicola]